MTCIELFLTAKNFVFYDMKYSYILYCAIALKCVLNTKILNMYGIIKIYVS